MADPAATVTEISLIDFLFKLVRDIPIAPINILRWHFD